MTDEEYRQQVQQRWKESMALLGIDDAGPAPAEHTPPPAPPPPPPPAKSAAVPSLRSPVQEDAAPAEPEPDWRRAVEPPEPMAQERHIDLEPLPVALEPVDDLEPAGETVEPAADEGAPADDKSGRRRRGRRGRRGSKEETTPAEGDSSAADRASDADDETPEKDGRRRRGRAGSRPRGPKPAEVEELHDDEPAVEEGGVLADFDDDEPTDFSEWNVPSWQDLIASLYRPDR